MWRSEESLRIGRGFGWVCKRRSLKINVDKNNMIVVGEESPRCKIILDGEQLKLVSVFKYLDEMATDDSA